MKLLVSGALVAGGLLRVLGAQTAAQAVSGSVTDARDGHPLARATVTLTETKMRDHGLTASTDGEGHFRFDAVPAGKYTLTGRAPRHLSSNYLQHGQFGTAIVTGAGLVTEDLKLPLSPVSRIAGTVLDEAGEPVRNASVILFREDPAAEEKVRQVQRKNTSEAGRYEFDQLHAGKFYVAATGTPWYAIYPVAEQPGAGQQGAGQQYYAKPNAQLNVAYPMIFYPAALDSEGAEALELKEGDQVTANLQMQPVPALTLTLKQPPGSTGGRAMPQLTRSVFGAEERVQVQYGTTGDAVEMMGVAPGRYQLEELSLPGQRPLQKREVDLRGESLAMDAAPAEETVNVKVSVRAAAGETLPAKLSVVLQKTKGGASSHVLLEGESRGVMANVVAGEYRVRVGSDQRLWNVAGMTLEGAAVAGSLMRVAGRKDVTLEVTITTSAAEIDGFVKRDGKPDVAAMVVLVPEGEAPDAMLFRRDQSDLDGSFGFSNVLPGKYRIVAIDDGWTLRWSEKGALDGYLAKGTAITVVAKGKSTMKVAVAVAGQGR